MPLNKYNVTHKLNQIFNIFNLLDTPFYTGKIPVEY